MNPIEHLIKTSLPHIGEKDSTLFAGMFERIKLKKGEMLLSQGEICQYLYFLSEGSCRYYTLKDGNDITIWFGFKNDFVTAFTSFFPQAPSYETIEMLTDGELYRIHYEKFASLKKSTSSFSEVIIHFITQYTFTIEQRLLMIQTLSAKEKYMHILENEPELVLQIPNKYLASYLGVTRETLSRIRSQV